MFNNIVFYSVVPFGFMLIMSFGLLPVFIVTSFLEGDRDILTQIGFYYAVYSIAILAIVTAKQVIEE